MLFEGGQDSLLFAGLASEGDGFSVAIMLTLRLIACQGPQPVSAREPSVHSQRKGG